MLQVEDDYLKSGNEVGKVRHGLYHDWYVCLHSVGVHAPCVWHSLSGTTLCDSTQIQALHPAKKVKPTKVNIIVMDGVIGTDGLLGPDIKRPAWLKAVPYVAMLEDVGQIQKAASDVQVRKVVVPLILSLSPCPPLWRSVGILHSVFTVHGCKTYPACF